MLSAAYDGKSSDKQPTIQYLFYRWRREMRISYQQMRETPLDVILADLEYISIERTIRAAKSQRNA